MQRKILLMLLSTMTIVWTASALADPPPWAPAHGWRKKHDPYYAGYTGTQWERDFEISSGRCDRAGIGQVLGGIGGGVAGAVIGSRVGQGDARTVATVVGAALGALIGSRIGRSLDDGDRACFGHAMEIGSPGRRVTWQNPSTGVNYVLIPGEGRRSDSGACRDYKLIATIAGRNAVQQGVACHAREGVWEVRK